MAQLTMYPAKAGSKRTTLTADLAADGTQAFVGDLSAFPPAPNLATLQSEATIWETCLYTEKSAESGAGYLTITRSGEGHDSSASGGALSWSSGAIISRNPCALDHDRFKANIEDIAANTQPLDATLTALSGITTAANKLPYATGKDAFDVCDFTSLGRSLVGETTESAIRDLISAASSTTGTQNIYVDSAATGTGDGTSWTNAFTTIQAAVNSLPAIINHAITIYIRKGTTAYTESTTVKRTVSAGSITIRGEYYWYGTNASSKTGKINLGASDYGYAQREQIEAGDVVLLMQWSGTIEASIPSAYYLDTVASVSGDEITLTTNTEVSFDTTWTYSIVKTSIVVTDIGIIVNTVDNVTISGLHIDASSGVSRAVSVFNAKNIIFNSCVLIGKTYGILTENNCYVTANRCYLKGKSAGCHSNMRSYIRSNYSVFAGIGSSIGFNAVIHSTGYCIYCMIDSANAMGFNASRSSYIYQIDNKNYAITPKSPANWASSVDGSYVS